MILLRSVTEGTMTRVARHHRRADLAILFVSGVLGLMVAVALVGAATGLYPSGGVPRPSSAGTPASQPAILVGAGDIADCESSADSLTGELIAGTPGQAFTLGDNAPVGRPRDYAVCYGESWGSELHRTHPIVGNQDYSTDDGRWYFAYFGARAGTAGYYSFDAGEWHVIVLNSECARVGGCGPGSRQGRWLAEDLATHRTTCTLALWHRPLVSSDRHEADAELRPFWDALYDAGVELVVNGHVHNYQRFAPQTPSLERDRRSGIRQIIAGTGGNQLQQLGEPIRNLEVQGRAHGVLLLRLYTGRYEWEFVPVRGESFRDSGQDTCHGAPTES